MNAVSTSGRKDSILSRSENGKKKVLSAVLKASVVQDLDQGQSYAISEKNVLK